MTKDPKLILNDNKCGQNGRDSAHDRPAAIAAFGNSTGDREMLEWIGAGAGARLKMLVLHDDATRDYDYGLARGLTDSKVGTFAPALYGKARRDIWTVIGMKNDWKRPFPYSDHKERWGRSAMQIRQEGRTRVPDGQHKEATSATEIDGEQPRLSFLNWQKLSSIAPIAICPPRSVTAAALI
jgi:hypothetical protein